MPVTNLYRLCAVKIGTTVIGQITDEAISPGIGLLLASDSASGQEILAAQDIADYRASFTTTAVKTALATLGLAAVDLATNNAVLYFAKFTAGGGVGASACATITMAKGIAYVETIAAGLGQAASVSVSIVPASADGTTSPVAHAAGVAMPTMAAGELYTLGSPTAIKSLSISSGIQAIADRADVDVYNTFVAAEPARPRVSYSLADLGTTELLTSVSTITLADVPQGGTRGSAPITFTMNQSLAHVSNIGGAPFATAYEVIPTYNGTNAPIVITGLT